MKKSIWYFAAGAALLALRGFVLCTMPVENLYSDARVGAASLAALAVVLVAAGAADLCIRQWRSSPWWVAVPMSAGTLLLCAVAVLSVLYPPGS